MVACTVRFHSETHVTVLSEARCEPKLSLVPLREFLSVSVPQEQIYKVE